MAMYDSVNLWLPIDKFGSIDLEKTLQSLSSFTEHTRDDNISYSGHLRNCKVNISGRGVSIKGSLAKYFLPDNFNTLTRSDSARAFEMMSDELSLPVESAKVTRLDFAQNFLMDYKPEAYYPYLGECQYYKRLPNDTSLYFKNSLRQKVFYNKKAEGRAKGLVLPDVWNGQNVLRYEMRFTRRLPKQFNQAEITASTLSDEKFYMKVFDKWLAEYEAINKLHSINFNLSKMNSPKDFWKQELIEHIYMVGPDKIMQKIENIRHKRTFDKPEYYSRLKRDLKEFCKTPDMTESSDLVAELDKKVKAAKRYYR
jgi:hypothetical protein